MRTGNQRVCSWLLTAAAVTACGPNEFSRGGDLKVVVSAEGLGANGYEFPPAPGQEVAMVDGWAVSFERILVAIGNVRLAESPDKNPTDQGQMGKTIALRKGPYVLDLKGKGTDLDKGGAGKVAIALPISDLKDRFELDQRYAFSFDLVPVTSDATFVNVDPDDADVVAMIGASERSLLVGHAAFKGQDCRSSRDSYDFSKLPREVDFRFGLEGKVSSVNCQNPDNQGEAIEGEEFQRGIQLLAHGVTVAQITIHTDHLFWPSVAHENLPLFDPLAANAVEREGRFSVKLSDLRTVFTSGVTDREKTPLPWRACVPESMYALPKTESLVTFDDRGQGLSNLYDFIQFNAATMGHLNADGLCYVANRPDAP